MTTILLRRVNGRASSHRDPLVTFRRSYGAARSERGPLPTAAIKSNRRRAAQRSNTNPRPGHPSAIHTTSATTVRMSPLVGTAARSSASRNSTILRSKSSGYSTRATAATPASATEPTRRQLPREPRRQRCASRIHTGTHRPRAVGLRDGRTTIARLRAPQRQRASVRNSVRRGRTSNAPSPNVSIQLCGHSIRGLLVAYSGD